MLTQLLPVQLHGITHRRVSFLGYGPLLVMSRRQLTRLPVSHSPCVGLAVPVAFVSAHAATVVIVVVVCRCYDCQPTAEPWWLTRK